MFPLRFCVCFFLMLAASSAEPLSNRSALPQQRASQATTAGLPSNVAPFLRSFPRSRMRTYGVTTPPIGYVGFCQREPEECKSKSSSQERISLTKARWEELNSINTLVNTLIAPASDEDLYDQPEYWTLPTTKGDCEDYVLLKRKKLIQLGWPESALLITVVRDEQRDGHAVLTVRTRQGDFVLDNKEPRILRWRQTPYDYIKRQSFQNPEEWVSLTPSISNVAGAAAANTEN